MNDGTFNFYNNSDKLYVGNGTTKDGNGAFNKQIVDAKLPMYFNEKKIYGTWHSCFENILTLKSVFVPRTYKEIQNDFCWGCSNLESVTFEENSQIEAIYGWFVGKTSISSITLPRGLKTLLSKATFSDCTKLKQVLFLGNIAVGNDDNIFYNVPSDLVIIVSNNYPSTTFGERSVNVISLPSPKRVLTCLKKHRINTSLLLMINICYSY